MGLRGAGTQTEPTDADVLLEVPDTSGLLGPLDHPGPYEEEPDSSTAVAPKPTLQNWSIQSESDFCSVHKVGYFCHDSTRVRCCKVEDGSYAKCGSTADSTHCGGHGATSIDTQNSSNSTLSASWFWRLHAGWHRAPIADLITSVLLFLSPHCPLLQRLRA